MPQKSRVRLIATLVCAASLASGIAGGRALASDKRHDALRQAVESGEIQSLSSILAAVRDKLPGEVTAIEAEKKKDRWIYEFRVVDPKGRLFEVYVDARSGDIILTKEK